MRTMIKRIYLLLLTGLLTTDCQLKNVGSDMATTLSGSYYVTYCQYLSGVTNACSGSATLTKINANTIQADYVLSSGNPFRETCSLQKTGNAINVRSGSGFGYYHNGELFMQFGDGTLHVHFRRGVAPEVS